MGGKKHHMKVLLTSIHLNGHTHWGGSWRGKMTTGLCPFFHWENGIWGWTNIRLGDWDLGKNWAGKMGFTHPHPFVWQTNAKKYDCFAVFEQLGPVEQSLPNSFLKNRPPAPTQKCEYISWHLTCRCLQFDWDYFFNPKVSAGSNSFTLWDYAVYINIRCIFRAEIFRVHTLVIALGQYNVSFESTFDVLICVVLWREEKNIRWIQQYPFISWRSRVSVWQLMITCLCQSN